MCISSPARPGGAAANEGDRVDEYTDFYRAEFTSVARTVHLIVHDRQRAEDVTQEAFLRLLQHWAKVSRYERPGAWVRRVAIRLATKQVGRERQRILVERDTGPRPSAGTNSLDLDLMDAIRSLPVKQRAAVVLFYFEDRPIVEIGDLLDCTESAVKVWLHRARHQLAEALNEEVSEDVS